MTQHIPTGFTALTPYLLIENATEFVRFAIDGLGATEKMMHLDDDGRVVHAELQLEGCMIELGTPNGDFNPTRASFHLYVEDPGARIARAIEHGATELYPLRDHDYGERSGGIADAWGNQWYIARVTDPEKRAV